MTAHWQPYREPLRATLTRTFAIAIVLGLALAPRWGGLARWPLVTLVMLWPSFGGHWVELWFLNWLRPRLPDAPAVQLGARLCVWFLAGPLFGLGMVWTATVVGLRPLRWPSWWVAGIGFIGVELVAHVALQLRRRPSVYNGRG